MSTPSQQKSEPKFSQESKLPVNNLHEEDNREINQNIAELSLHEGQNIDMKTDYQSQTQRFYPDQQHSQQLSQTVPTQDHSQAEHPQASSQLAHSQEEEEYPLTPMEVEYINLQERILATDRAQGNLMWPGREQAYRRMHHLWDEIGKLEQK